MYSCQLSATQISDYYCLIGQNGSSSSLDNKEILKKDTLLFDFNVHELITSVLDCNSGTNWSQTPV